MKRMDNIDSVEDWERTRVSLLEKERHLTQLSVRGARGEVSSEQLDALRREVEQLRMLDGIKFKLAFPLVRD
jgi:hypothetical protein